MKKWGAALAAILALAAVLRIRGISFGLPAIYNPDEIAIMSRALGFAGGDPNPHNFLYPTLYFYALFAWEGLYFVAGRLICAIPSLSAFEQSFFLDPTGIYLSGRVLQRRVWPADGLGHVAIGQTSWRPGHGRCGRDVSCRRAIRGPGRALRETRRAGHAAHHARRDGSRAPCRGRFAVARPTARDCGRDGWLCRFAPTTMRCSWGFR